ncbi:MAG: choice-of-anchor D domain-containing protein [Acidobacteriota bacterium]
MKRKLWVIISLACFFIGASFWLLTPGSETSASAASAAVGTKANTPAKITLHVSGRYEKLGFVDAADLPENVNTLGGLTQPIALAQQDVNNDSVPDLVTSYATNGGSELRVRLASPTGEFTDAPQSYTLAAPAKALAFGDFNVDGAQDIAIANAEAGTLSLLLGSDQGIFTTGPTINLGGSLVTLTAGDINRDGLTDLLTVDEASNAVRLVINQGDLSTSEMKVIKPIGLGQIAFAKFGDFDNDFRLDIAIASNSGLAVFYGDEKGNFPREQRLAYANSVRGMVVGDLNGDHFPDLAVSGSSGITVWFTRREKGFSKPKSFSAGEGVRDLVAGNFNSDDYLDLAVINDGTSQVSVLLNSKGGNLSEPLSMDVDQNPVALTAGNFRRHGIEGIAISKADGGTVLAIQPLAITLQVSTLNDENDCPSCTSAQLTALKGPLGAPGGSTGISLREALTALNNDFVTSNKANQGVGFQTLSTTSGPPPNANVESDTRSICGTATNQTYWFIALTGGNLPPILAPGTAIDGTVVNTSALSGATNTLGSKVILSGGGIIITSSAPNCMIKGVAIINAPQNAIVASSNGNMITQNNIGFDCDTITPGPNALSGIVLSGTSSTQVTNNFIGANGQDGIQVNGISLAVSIPQNNTLDNNRIGVNRVGTTLVPGTVISAANLRDGIRIQSGATGNTITNSTIGGNLGFGINVSDNITSNTTIRSNRVGIDPSGQIALPNVLGGVSISTLGNSKFNTVTQNLISGNGVLGLTAIGMGNGVRIASGDVQAQFNIVAINKIGVNSTGSVQVPNLGDGLLITGSSNGNTIGGTQPANFNQISGNIGTGVHIGGTVAPANPNNNLIQNNDIGANNLGTGAPFDPNTPAAAQPRSNKGGGVFVDGAAFANTIFLNDIAFNNDTAVMAPVFNPPATPVSGITHSATTLANNATFNTFSSNNVFLNPPDVLAVTPNINVTAGQEGILNNQINNVMLTSLIKIDSAITVTSTGQTTIKGTVNFLDNSIPANINLSQIEVFVSKRGSEVLQSQSEGQLFLNAVISFQPNSQNNNTLDWSASLIIPAPFINPTQTNTLFLTATVTTGDGSTSPFSIGKVPQFVSGVGQCSLTVTPSTLTFSNAPVNQGTTQTVTLTNAGSSLITVTAFGFAQSGGAFTVTGPSLPFTLSAGQSQTLMVTFTPTNNTTQNATLNISNSCTGTSSVSITGNGCQPTIAVSPTSVDFGSLDVGQTATRDVTVTNSGCTAVALVFTAQLSGNSATSFTIAPNPPAPNVVRIAFAPNTTGAMTGTLVISSTNASNSPVNVPITGTGTMPAAPQLQVTPANVIFGDVPVNTTATQAITVRNIGNAPLSLTTPTLTAGGTLGFSVSSPLQTSIPAGQSTTFQVSFRPNTTGPANGSVTVTSNGGSQILVLSGNGTASRISLATPSLDFGVVPINQTASRTVIISNIGTAPLDIQSFSLTSGGANGFALPSTTPFTVQPNSTGQITVNFTPTTAGPRSDTLSIRSNDPATPTVTVSLTGTASDSIAPIVTVLSPAAGIGVGSGQQFTGQFTTTDNIGVTTFEVRLSTNGGATFDFNVASGTAQSGTNSFTAVAPPGIETTSARIQVAVRDAAGNVGTGTNPGNFTLANPPLLFATVIVDGRFKTNSAGSNIQPGAVLVVGGETFTLQPNARGSRFIVKRSTVGSQGTRFSSITRPGSTLTVTVRNPNGISSSPVTITAQ